MAWNGYIPCRAQVTREDEFAAQLKGQGRGDGRRQKGRGRESVRCGEAGLRLVPSAKGQLRILLHPEQTLHTPVSTLGALGVLVSGGRLLDGIHEYLG